MGTAIAIEHARRSIPVVLMDKSPEALRLAAAIASGELAAAERCAGQFTQRQPIVYTLDEADLAGCDLVLESIVEKAPAKQALFAQIRRHLSENTILATNTSSIPIARLASGVADLGRFCGLHFCHPVRLRPLVEVAPGPATSPATVAAVVAHANFLGKLPMVVNDGHGFVVNRLLLTYLHEALAMVSSGMQMQQIDGAMVDYGMPLGPLELLDEIGLDTALQSGVVLAEIFSERSGGIELLVRLVKAKQLGMKSGSGFYGYPGKTPNPTCGKIVEALHGPQTRQAGESAGPAEIVKRLLRPMVTEGARMLQENQVAAAWQIDIATIFGLGFPLRRGGLLRPGELRGQF